MVSSNPSVLIVDDEDGICQLLSKELSDRGFLCSVSHDGESALSELKTKNFDVALLDIRLPGISGIDVLRTIHDSYNRTAVVMVTAHDSVNTAVEAMKLGAVDYIVKPFDIDTVCHEICTAISSDRYVPRENNDTLPFQHAPERRINRMDTIARGVEARLSQLLDHQGMVTRKTITVARQLGIPEAEILEWAAARSALEAEAGNRAGTVPEMAMRDLFAEGMVNAAEVLLHDTQLRPIPRLRG